LNRLFDELALLSEPSFSSRASWENARAAGRRLLRTVLSLRPHSGRKDQMTACIRRRAFITLLGGAAVGWPLAASGQEFGRIYRVGALIVSPRDAPHHVAFFDELRRLGFIDGQNLAVDVGGYSLSIERLAGHAADLVKGQVDVILATGDEAVRSAQRATTTIPILAITDDMVGQGLVHSLAKPGGNTTGITILASELDGKRQEILIEVVSGLRRIAALVDSNTTTPSQLRVLEDAARARGVELSIHQVAWREEIGSAIDAAKAAGAGALNVLASTLLFNSRAFIFNRVEALHLPAVYQFPEMAEQGGLIAYGPPLVPLFREIMSRQLAKLLRGSKPVDLPVEQPTKFELVINLKTARALGLEIAPTLLGRADKVIE
jgi:putative tryptophan/tyrosine transport system substrate-binding protein